MNYKKLLTFITCVFLTQTSFATFYDGVPYANQSQITAEVWVDGVKLFNASGLDKKYSLTQTQIDCLLAPTPNLVNDIDEHIRELISPSSVQKLNEFYNSDLGSLYLSRQHRKALKHFGYLPADKDTRLPVKEGREVLKVLESQPMKIIRELNQDYFAVGMMKAYAIDKRYECDLNMLE